MIFEASAFSRGTECSAELLSEDEAGTVTWELSGLSAELSVLSLELLSCAESTAEEEELLPDLPQAETRMLTESTKHKNFKLFFIFKTPCAFLV